MHFVSPLVLAATVVSAAPAVVDLTYVARNVTPQALIAQGRARLAQINGGSSSNDVLVKTGPAQNLVGAYVAPIKIGGKVYQLIVDTGSSNTWCGAKTSCEPSSTGKSTGGSVQVSYGSGSFSGTEYTDKVTYAGLTVTSQSIGAASSSSGFSGVDGIVGFGPVDLTQGTVSNANTVPTFMDNLFKQGSIPVESLGVYFAPFNPSTSNGKNGQLALGGPNTAKTTSAITYFPKLNDGSVTSLYWGLAFQSFQYGSTTLGTNLKGIVDTGTTLIFLPSNVFSSLLSASGGSVDPNTGFVIYNTQPTQNFVTNVNGKALPLTPTQYLIPQYLYSLYGLQSGKYYGWFTNGGTGSVNCIIGNKFLESYYSVYDTTNSRIGFAPRK